MGEGEASVGCQGVCTQWRQSLALTGLEELRYGGDLKTPTFLEPVPSAPSQASGVG